MINTVINIVLGLDIMTVVTAIATSLLCFFLAYFALKKDDYVNPAFVGFVLLITFIYPNLWLFNHGSKGPTPYFIIFNALLVTIICDRKRANILYSLQLLFILILGYVEMFHGEFITGYESEMAYTLDLSLSFTLVGLFSLLIIRRLMKEYNLRIEELHALQNEFKKLSITDELTGIYNRRHIIQEINLKLAGDIDIPFAVIMIDIDDFKSINDRFGHTVGDEVIIGVGRTLEECVRPIDVVGRIGGEEFLVVLMDTSENEARKRALHIRNRISELKWSVDALQVTISGGVCSKMPDDALNDLLERVDRYLYKAKRSGKNTIV